MYAMRRGFMRVVALSAVLAALCIAGPAFGKGGGGGGGGGGKSTQQKAKPKTVLDEIDADSSLSKFAAALKQAELESTLKGSGPYTVLAPSDSAFDKVDKTKMEELMNPKNKSQLKALLEGHILSSKMTAADIAKATKLSAMGGVSHTVKVGDDKQAVIDGTAKITKSDVAGSNGLVQIIDTVLLPPSKEAPPKEQPAKDPPK